ALHQEGVELRAVAASPRKPAIKPASGSVAAIALTISHPLRRDRSQPGVRGAPDGRPSLNSVPASAVPCPAASDCAMRSRGRGGSGWLPSRSESQEPIGQPPRTLGAAAYPRGPDIRNYFPPTTLSHGRSRIAGRQPARGHT